MKTYKSPQFPDNRAWFQSGFADGWSKPHPYGIDGAYFAQRTPRSTQRVGGLMSPPYDGLLNKYQFVGLPKGTFPKYTNIVNRKKAALQ